VDRWRRVRAIAANYGCDEGWYVYWHGLRIAELTEWRFEEMFWDSYQLTPLTENADTVARINTNDFWRNGNATFRTRSTDLPSARAVLASNAPVADRIPVRGLYVEGARNLWEHILVRGVLWRLSSQPDA
jgi:hypothetical protein